MPLATLDGIATVYEVTGSGQPLLMFSPGGFDATRHKWRTLGIYAKTRMLDALNANFQCIAFDRRECGDSGGRVEIVSWRDYAAQGRALLDHLGIARAHLIGGCMGCGPVAAFAAAWPEAVHKMAMVWPVGGAKYRINGQLRFAQHAAYVQQHGLDAVLALARSGDASFGEDPRGGPWASVLRRDAAFAEAYVRHDRDAYLRTVLGMARTLLDRDTAPGAEPEALLRLAVPALVVPGRDASHATSAARYLEECLAGSSYIDLPPAEQTEAAVVPRLVQFLQA